MLSNVLDLTYYIKINCSAKFKKSKLKYVFYGFTIPKRLLNDNNIDKPLPYYRLGK